MVSAVRGDKGSRQETGEQKRGHVDVTCAGASFRPVLDVYYYVVLDVIREAWGVWARRLQPFRVHPRRS